MKTQGIEIVEGLLIVPYRKAVPPAFWARLRHHIAKASLNDDFAADHAHESMSGGNPWDREERLFRRWVERLELVGPLWPWERGWTVELCDSYLDAPAARAA